MAASIRWVTSLYINPVERQEFIECAPVNDCQRVQAPDTKSGVLCFDGMQAAGRDDKSRIVVPFRNLQTCRVHVTHGQAKVLTNAPKLLRRVLIAAR